MDALEGFVTMVGHVAWPVTAMGIAVIARKELRSFFAALAKRIEDKNCAVSITKEGLEIRAVVEAQEARLASMQAEQDQVKSLALMQLKPARSLSATTLGASEPRAIDDHLREMADAYMSINIPDFSERVRAKNIAAEKMAFYIASSNIDKDQLACEKHEGLLVALAESIILSADSGDAGRLLKAATGTKRTHARHRVLIAISKLIERNLLPLPELGKVRELLYEYEAGANGFLKRLISSVTSLVNETVHVPKD